MTQVIYKYQIGPDVQTIMLPADARPLTVQMQYQIPQMWVLLDPFAEKTERYFAVIGTGHEFEPSPDQEFKYIGTFQMNDGQLVWHLFEIIKREIQSDLFTEFGIEPGG